ncbi:MAG TPA: dihydrodipicolinate synthase family protein [Parafilimonas sp.]|nr:dihydrodipicolinate synthase family protein [Parafilimonas sp.]
MKQNVERGFIPVMLTPFKENGEIDFDGLTSLTELYIQAGAKGLFANCQSSEMFHLSDEEKLLIVKHTIKVADGRVPVVAVGNFGTTIAEQADFIRKIYDTGVKAVIIVTGLIAEENESDEVFNARMFELFSLTGNIPLGFYECPQPYKRLLSAEQLEKFVATGRVIYHKDTCLDIEMVKDKLKVTSGNDAFGLYDAYAVNAVASLKAGAAGLSCIQGNFFPELIVWLCDNFNDNDANGSIDKVQQFLTDTMDVIHYAYPVVAKYYLQKRGINISTFSRTNTEPFTAEVKDKVDRLYYEYDLLNKELAANPIYNEQVQ